MEMTLYEYRDLLTSMQSGFVEGLQLYITLLSGYLLVAYFIGKKLTKFQVLSVSILYALTISADAGILALQSLETVNLNVEMYSAYGVGTLKEPKVIGPVING